MSIASTSAPISAASQASTPLPQPISATQDRKSTRLNSSHSQISYAVFCLKKKKHVAPPLARAPHALALHPHRPDPQRHALPPPSDRLSRRLPVLDDASHPSAASDQRQVV